MLFPKFGFAHCRFVHHWVVYHTCIRYSLGAVLLTGFADSALMASMTVTPMIIHFVPGEPPRQDITVTNPDTETLYLETEISRVENPGTSEEKKVLIANPDQVKLLVTPQKSVISAGQLKNIRLISLETPEKEQIYRVTFKPVIGNVRAKQHGVKILIAYEALVFVHPKKPTWQISASLDGNELTFANSGNTNVTIRNVRFCSGSKESDCQNLDVHNRRVYGDQNSSSDIPKELASKQGVLKYGVYDGKKELPQSLKINQKQVTQKQGNQQQVRQKPKRAE